MEQKYGYTIMDGLIAVDMSVLDTSAKLRAVCSKYKITLTKTMTSHSLLLFGKGQENIYEVRKMDGCFAVVPLRMHISQPKQDIEKILEYVRSLIVQTKLPPSSLNKMRYTVYVYMQKGTSPSDIPMKLTSNATTDIFGITLSCEHAEFERRLVFGTDYALTTQTSTTTSGYGGNTNVFQSPTTGGGGGANTGFGGNTNVFQSPATGGFGGNGTNTGFGGNTNAFQPPATGGFGANTGFGGNTNAFQPPATGGGGFGGAAFGNGFNTNQQFKNPFTTTK
jgi:hypothetical protein